MSVSGIEVAGNRRKMRTSPPRPVSGAARRVQRLQLGHALKRVGTLADNVGRHEVVPGLASQARHLSIFFPNRLPLFFLSNGGSGRGGTGSRVYIYFCLFRFELRIGAVEWYGTIRRLDHPRPL